MTSQALADLKLGRSAEAPVLGQRLNRKARARARSDPLAGE